jgi:hypothetical protein
MADGTSKEVPTVEEEGPKVRTVPIELHIIYYRKNPIFLLEFLPHLTNKEIEYSLEVHIDLL